MEDELRSTSNSVSRMEALDPERTICNNVLVRNLQHGRTVGLDSPAARDRRRSSMSSMHTLPKQNKNRNSKTVQEGKIVRMAADGIIYPQKTPGGRPMLKRCQSEPLPDVVLCSNHFSNELVLKELQQISNEEQSNLVSDSRSPFLPLTQTEIRPLPADGLKKRSISDSGQRRLRSFRSSGYGTGYSSQGSKDKSLSVVDDNDYDDVFTPEKNLEKRSLFPGNDQAVLSRVSEDDLENSRESTFVPDVESLIASEPYLESAHNIQSEQNISSQSNPKKETSLLHTTVEQGDGLYGGTNRYDTSTLPAVLYEDIQIQNAVSLTISAKQHSPVEMFSTSPQISPMPKKNCSLSPLSPGKSYTEYYVQQMEHGLMQKGIPESQLLGILSDNLGSLPYKSDQIGAVKTDHKQLFEAIGAPKRRTTEMIPEKDEFLLDDVMDEECRTYGQLYSTTEASKRLEEQLLMASRCNCSGCKDPLCLQGKLLLDHLEQQLEAGQAGDSVSCKQMLHCLVRHSCSCDELRCRAPWCSYFQCMQDLSEVDHITRLLCSQNAPIWRFIKEPLTQATYTKLNPLLEFDEAPVEGRDWHALTCLGKFGELKDVALGNVNHSDRCWIVKRMDGDQERLALLQEIQKYQHPLIVRFHWALLFPKVIYLCMEQEYSSLEESLKGGGQLDHIRVMVLMHQAASVATFLHAKRIIYLLWTCGHIMFSREGNMIRLTNFSAAVQLDQDWDEDSIEDLAISLPPAITPRELLNGGEPSVEDDIWGIGCLGYELLEGHKVYNEWRHLAPADMRNMFKEVTPENLPLCTDIRLKAIIESCWEEREQRLSADIISTLLDTWIAEAYR